ncbi:unnamed protein product [Spirodela intermedia]|uniref:Uncharacterized protein n=1 Tax=Spirodela intermedia TaxID=51605 RepID=A0A7I8J3T0_SPIIN|nr:unnamed protein product [Spirodela intermedia]CAA6664750.1 unnamed protein product [Spirodela intermedia]
MGNRSLALILFLLIIPSRSAAILEWLPFSASRASEGPAAPDDRRAQFSVEPFNDESGKKILADARTKLLTLNSCWQEAYRGLFSSCSEIITDEEKHSRLAWQLSDCFIRDSGRPAVPVCTARSAMKDCRKKLSDFEHEIYLQFFIQTNSLCHQLQAGAFKRETERLVNELKRSAQAAEDTLESIEGKSQLLLESSSKIQDSLIMVDSQTRKLAQASSNVEAQIVDVLKQSMVISEQTKGIRVSQGAVLEGQVEMKQKLESGMAVLQESYENLGTGMEKLRSEATEMGRKINEVGDLMNSKMRNLQNTADDIGRIALTSLDNQKQLVDGQTRALEELKHLTKFQSDALEESRSTLQNLVAFGHKQQEELLLSQEQIQDAHNRLFQSSQSILAAQEEFEKKQANIFAALEKLFALHNAILLESRFIKSIFFYSCMIFFLYLLTSTKQAFNVRARLYLGMIMHHIHSRVRDDPTRGDGVHQQARIASRISLLRSSFLIASALQILHSIFTYRDYELLNHRLLQRLTEKIDAIEQNTGKYLLPWNDDGDSDFSGYSWIDQELPEEVNSREDPDYELPEGARDDNTARLASSGRKYELRPRRRP